MQNSALLPSEAEGFGLPVVEALACGTRVLASDLPVLREVGGDAVNYAAVGSLPVWRDEAIRLLGDPAPSAGRDPRLERRGNLAGPGMPVSSPMPTEGCWREGSLC